MADAKASAQRIEQLLDQQIAAAERSQKVTIIIGLILIVFLVGYLSWSTYMVKKMIEPKEVIGIAMVYVEPLLPQGRETIVEQVRLNSNTYIDEAIKVVMTRIPDGRQQLEMWAVDRFNELLYELNAQLNEFTDFAIEQQRDTVNEMMAMLDTDMEANVLEEELYGILMEPIQTSSLQADLRAYGAALMELADLVEKLAADDNLTEIQVVQRDLLIALKVLSERSN
ncbi:MAG: hypothetical protein KF858_15000 [Candidatus Sumerlaeia bacterium]|nr:hypothetical protein [Candidatus Sumerlaeia bacterium]